MKKLILLSLCILFITGCNKKTTKQAQTTQTQTNNLSSQETQLMGSWIMDSAVTYSNSIRQYGSTYSSPATCRINFYSTVAQNDYTSKNCDAGHLSCVLTNGLWKAPNINYVSINNVIYSIDFITTNSLILGSGGGTGTMKYFFHK